MEAQQKAPDPSLYPLLVSSPGNAATHSSAPPNPPQDRRTHPRYAVDEDAVLLVVNHSASLQCRILELSLNGCRLRTLHPFTLPARPRVEVTFKVHGVAFRFLGVVQWTGNQHFVGIRFIDTTSRRTEQLAEVISEIETAAREKAANEAASKLLADTVAEKQAREQTEIEERHWAEIQKAARKARAARQAGALRAVLQQPARVRRVDPRHQMDTSATIVLIKTGSRLKGRIVDLSVSGCRIRADQRFSADVYTRVETEFQFGGLPFLLGGVIQNIHDPLTVGIRFLDLSDRKRQQVEQLIAEISEQEPKEPAS